MRQNKRSQDAGIAINSDVKARGDQVSETSRSAEILSGATGSGVEQIVLDAVVQLLEPASVADSALLDKSLPQLGFTSLLAIALQYRLNVELRIMVPIEQLLSARALGDLIDQLRRDADRILPARSEGLVL